MQDRNRLTIIRAIHTAVYAVMAVSVFVVLYAGASGSIGAWLWVALLLLILESIVFAGSGFRCPLTALAIRYGARTGHAFDTFLPEAVTRRTFLVFGGLWAIGLLLLVLRWMGVLQ